MITLNSSYTDSPSVTLSNGTKWPNNDNKTFTYTSKSITTAVQQSINTIAVRVAEDVGIDTSYYYLTQKLGLTTVLGDADESGLSDKSLAPLALGQLTNGAKVREMTSAYCAIANEGVYTQSKTFYMIYDSDQEVYLDNSSPKSSTAFGEDTANTLTQLLYNAVENGTGTAAKLASGMAVAGKTGTTGDNKDRWFCGYTPYYVAAVWTGYDTPAEISTSGNPAAKIWNRVMALVHENLEVKSFDTGVTLTTKTDAPAAPSTVVSPPSSPSPSPSDDLEVTPSEEPPTSEAEEVLPSETADPMETTSPEMGTQNYGTEDGYY